MTTDEAPAGNEYGYRHETLASLADRGTKLEQHIYNKYYKRPMFKGGYPKAGMILPSAVILQEVPVPLEAGQERID